MKFTSIGIEGAWEIDQIRHGDDRGWFQESFKSSLFVEHTGVHFVPAQSNISKSQAGTIRGIHYSIAPEGQGKLVTVMSGAIDDYVVDVRTGSPTFGQWRRIRLDAHTPKSVLIDPHLGHAFQAIENDTVVSYMVTAEFNPTAELTINPMCATLAIEWNSSLGRVLSDKDIAAPNLREREESNELPKVAHFT